VLVGGVRDGSWFYQGIEFAVEHGGQGNRIKFL